MGKVGPSKQRLHSMKAKKFWETLKLVEIVKFIGDNQWCKR
jgi:hypothetical protein